MSVKKYENKVRNDRDDNSIKEIRDLLCSENADKVNHDLQLIEQSVYQNMSSLCDHVGSILSTLSKSHTQMKHTVAASLDANNAYRDVELNSLAQLISSFSDMASSKLNLVEEQIGHLRTSIKSSVATEMQNLLAQIRREYDEFSKKYHSGGIAINDTALSSEDLEHSLLSASSSISKLGTVRTPKGTKSPIPQK